MENWQILKLGHRTSKKLNLTISDEGFKLCLQKLEFKAHTS